MNQSLELVFDERYGRDMRAAAARIRPEIIEAFEKMRPTTKDPAS